MLVSAVLLALVWLTRIQLIVFLSTGWLHDITVNQITLINDKNAANVRRCFLPVKCSAFVIDRYVVGSNRVLLMLKDGSQAWEVKDFLVQQDRCEVVTIEGKDYPGKGSAQVA